MGFRPMQRLGDKARLPEQGRIRLGKKVPKQSGGTRPDKLTTLRFTSPDKAALAEVARLWGGQVQPWQATDFGGKPIGQPEWEVVTETAEVEIVLPRDPLGGTPLYELWNAGGLQRRCDGELCSTPVQRGKDVEYEDVPCVCNARSREECKPTTRLRVILPQLPFAGTWRLETHSWNAAQELPGMVDVVDATTGGGFVKAFLGVRVEEKMEQGKKKEFIVPYVRLDTSLAQALTGGAIMQALPVAPVTTGEVAPDLQSGAAPAPPGGGQTSVTTTGPADDDIAEAEIISDDDAEELHRWKDDLNIRAAAHLQVNNQAWMAAIAHVVDGDMAKQLTADDLRRLESMLGKVEAGTHRLELIDDRAVLLAHKESAA